MARCYIITYTGLKKKKISGPEHCSSQIYLKRQALLLVQWI